MAKVKDLKYAVTITKGFPGTYDWNGYTGYRSPGSDIHFTVNGGDNDVFSAFHITPDVLDGTNVGIWFNFRRGKLEFSSINTNNLPSSKEHTFNTWWAANRENVISAANEFWSKVQ